jgi:ABC-type transporter Mla subunit MlaD
VSADPRLLAHLHSISDSADSLSDSVSALNKNIGGILENQATSMDDVSTIAHSLEQLASAQRRLADIEAYRQLSNFPATGEQQAKAKILRERIMADIT